MKYITQQELEEFINNGKAKEFETRKEISKGIETLRNERKEFSTFTLLDDWNYVEGVRWVNAVGYVLMEGEVALIENW